MILIINPDEFESKEALDAELESIVRKLNRRKNAYEITFLPPSEDCIHNRIRFVILPNEDDANFTGVNP